MKIEFEYRFFHRCQEFVQFAFNNEILQKHVQLFQPNSKVSNFLKTFQ